MAFITAPADFLTAGQVPDIPEYQIQRLDIRDTFLGDDGRQSVVANVSLTAHNNFPVSLTVPTLGFNILVANCDSGLPLIRVATATSNLIDVVANDNITADASGVIKSIPDNLIRTCPETKLSPLDEFMKRYLRGETAKIYVQGDMETSDLPEWVGSFVENMTIPISFPGRELDDLIRNLTLTDVDFKLPSPFAGPNDPDHDPRVSGTVEVLVALPDGFNMDIGVNRLRALGDLYYHGTKFGELQLRKWQRASSERLTDAVDFIKISSKVIDAPIEITDSKTFADLLQKMLFGDEEIILDVVASVDANMTTAVGAIVIRDVPAKGKVPVNGRSSPW